MAERKPLYISPSEPGKRRFEDLECYKLALEVMANVHTFSKTLPPDEKFDLYSQIRRSSKGVTGNIGERYGRYHYLDSLHYYSIARGELNETLARLICQTEQALNGFMAYVRRQRAGSQEYGDKKIHEDLTVYDVPTFDESGDQEE